MLYRSDSKLTPRWFYKGLLDRLGVEVKFYRGDSKRQLHMRLEVIRGVHGKTVVTIEMSHFFERETLEEISFLLNCKMDSLNPMALILVGQNELREKLILQRRKVGGHVSKNKQRIIQVMVILGTIYFVYINILYPAFVLRKVIKEDEIENIFYGNTFNYDFIKSWEINSIKKYDDKFTSPSVEITFDKKIKVKAYISKGVDYIKYNEYDMQLYKIEDIEVERYSYKEKIIYSFWSENILYSVFFLEEFEKEVISKIRESFL